MRNNNRATGCTGETQMNCCDDYGECRQGRDCPIRIQKNIDMSVEEGIDVSWFPIIIFGVSLVITIVILLLS